MVTGVENQLLTVSHRLPDKPQKSLFLRRGCLEAVLIFVCCLTFISTLRFGFVYDDRGQVLDNPYIRSWSYLGHDFASHVWAQTTSRPATYYRPLFLCWLRLNHSIFGTRAWGWHMSTLLAHIIATLLVFRLALRLLQDRWQAAVSGLLFALHPVHVESVAWVSGVVDPLFSIFFLGSLLCYLNWRLRHSRGWFAGSLVLAALAMLSKETAVTMPAVVFVCEWILSPSTGIERTRQKFRGAALAALPFVLVAGAYLALRHAVLQIPSPIYANPATAVLTIPGLLLFYLRLVIWPVGLSLFYDRHYLQHLTVHGFVIPLILLAAVALALAFFRRHSAQGKQVKFSVAFALVVLCPVLWVRWLPDNDFLHDRYLYLPIAGFSMLAAIAITEFGGKTMGGWIAPQRQVLTVAVIALPLIFVDGMAQTYWADDLSLWLHCLRTSPHNRQVLNNLASTLGERGEYGKAVALFEEILQQNPNDADVQGNLGYTLYLMGALRPAEEHLSYAVQLDASNAKALLYLGITHDKLGLLPLAESELQRAITLEPARKGVHLALSLVLEQRGDLVRARREMMTELAYYPDETMVRERLNRLQIGPTTTP
jgi:tetratricopeptide (TPR) repeat protein